MKLKNVKIGMIAVVKKQDNCDLSKGEIVRVVDIEFSTDELNVRNVQVENRVNNYHWLNHKDIKKLKGV